jgi:hypothetical protein
MKMKTQLFWKMSVPFAMENNKGTHFSFGPKENSILKHWANFYFLAEGAYPSCPSKIFKIYFKSEMIS